MKILPLLLLCLLYAQAYCQQAPAPAAQLRLVRQATASPVVLTVKGHKKIKVETLSGEKHIFRVYNLVGDSAIASQADTVLLRDIARIRGSVRGDAPRKALGWMMVSTGLVGSVYGTALGVLGVAFGGSGALMLIPLAAYGWTVFGATLIESRSFDTASWNLQIVSIPVESPEGSTNVTGSTGDQR